MAALYIVRVVVTRKKKYIYISARSCGPAVGIDHPMPEARKIEHGAACTGIQPIEKPHTFFKVGSVLGLRFPNLVKPEGQKRDKGEKVNRDVRFNDTLLHNVAIVLVVPDTGIPGVKDGSATGVMEEIVDNYYTAYHDLGNPWPPPMLLC